MTRSLAAALVAALAATGCATEANERICATDLRCPDTATPFCDLDGVLGPTRNSCIDLRCTAGDALTCRDEVAYVCNALADGYDRVSCSLGCSDDELRCRRLAASNGLDAILASASSAPGIDLIDGDVFDVATGAVTNGGTIRRQLLGTRIVAIAPGGVDAMAYAASSLILRGAVRLVDPARAGLAVALLVDGDIAIEGTLVLAGTSTAPPPGSIDCSVGIGRALGSSSIGGGGGGHATPGGASGGFTGVAAVGEPGGAGFVHPTLEPLRGGCHGGARDATYASRGGGAIQISSATSVTLGTNAVIDASAQVSVSPFGANWGAGGGAGGAILIEAPRVLLRTGSLLSANGVGGASGDGAPASQPVRGAPSLGQPCYLQRCTRGGDGGYLGLGPLASDSTAWDGTAVTYTGGGGGAAGVIRINAAGGMATIEPGVLITPIPSQGRVSER